MGRCGECTRADSRGRELFDPPLDAKAHGCRLPRCEQHTVAITWPTQHDGKAGDTYTSAYCVLTSADQTGRGRPRVGWSGGTRFIGAFRYDTRGRGGSSWPSEGHRIRRAWGGFEASSMAREQTLGRANSSDKSSEQRLPATRQPRAAATSRSHERAHVKKSHSRRSASGEKRARTDARAALLRRGSGEEVDGKKRKESREEEEHGLGRPVRAADRRQGAPRLPGSLPHCSRAFVHVSRLSGLRARCALNI
jgi:hypothetical protein